MEPAKQVRKAVGAQVFRLRHGEQFDEKSRKLDDVIVSAPRMPVARTDGEAEPTIEPGRPLEIAHRMDHMIKTAGHRSAFTSPPRTPSAAETCSLSKRRSVHRARFRTA